MLHYLQFHIKGDDEDGGERAASREPGQLKTGSESFSSAHPFRAEAVKPGPVSRAIFLRTELEKRRTETETGTNRLP